MLVKRKQKNNINIGVIDTDRFKTNVINLSFVSKTNGKDNVYTKFLTSILPYTTKKYNTKIKLAKKSEDLYTANIYCNYNIIGNLKIINFTLIYINSKYLEEKIDLKAIDLLFEVVFNPNVNNNKFEEKIFNIVKNNIYNNKKRMDEYAGAYSFDKFLKQFADGPGKYSRSGELKDIKEMNEKDLYKYYKSLYNMNLDISIVGDNIDDDVENYMLKKLNKYNFKRTKIDKIDIIPKIKNKIKETKETKSFNQSQLIVGYKFKDITEYERTFVLPLYNIILGGDINSLLFKSLRENNGLCYGVSSSINKYDSTLVISSGINKINYEKALNLIQECVNNMDNEKEISNLLNIAKKNIETSLNVFYDDNKEMMYYILLNNYIDIKDVEAKKKIYNKVTLEEIISLNKKINLDTIYFLEGEKENE